MNMKLLRKKVGLTQKEVAERIAVSQVYVSKIERGEVDGLTIYTLKKLAKVLKVTVYEMLKILIEGDKK